MDTTALRDELLVAALPNVPFDGWGQKSLGYAAEAVGVDHMVAEGAFPGGAMDLVAHFSDWTDRQMLAAMAHRRDHAAADSGPADDAAHLTEALRVRLEILQTHKDAVRRSLALLAMPANAALSARLLYRGVDAVCRAAGDGKTDFTFYIHRGLLAGVAAAATLYWLNDKSDDHEATWSFIDRRVRSMLAVERRLAGAGRLARLAEAPFRLAASVQNRRRRRAAGA